MFLSQERTWPRFYHADGSLVLLPEEVEKQHADALTDEVARLREELARLQGGSSAHTEE